MYMREKRDGVGRAVGIASNAHPPARMDINYNVYRVKYIRFTIVHTWCETTPEIVL